jgi:excinuclease ABC subunit C
MTSTYIQKEKMNEIPKVSGVYSFWAKRDLLYIGKAGNLRERVKTHFMQPNYRDNLFIEHVSKIGYMETESEIEALLLESQLIKEHMPKYNVMWKDGKNYFYILITKEDFSRVLITHQQSQSGIYVGPFVDGKAIKRTLRSLRKIFPYYTKKHENKLCQYCHLGLCPGPPPAGGPNKQEYKKNIKNLASVLQGKRTSVLKKLQKEMKEASKAQQYEKAGKLRDQVEDLEIVFSHAKILRPEEEKAPIDWSPIQKYLQKVFGTKHSISRVEAYDISNTQGQESTSSMPVFVDGKPAKEHYRKFKIHPPAGGPEKPNDFAMLEETITRRLRHKEWGYPDLMIIDGGKGQLSSVLKALKNFQFSNPNFQNDIKVAAIAKKNNELFLPGKSDPLLLRDMPQPVSNVILHIRDEAHRFAITYHRKLRKLDLLGKTR